MLRKLKNISLKLNHFEAMALSSMLGIIIVLLILVVVTQVMYELQ